MTNISVSRSKALAPTEYGHSYSYSRTRAAPRPRNPVTGWQNRNLSNILPSGSESETPSRPTGGRGRSAGQQTWPWLARPTRSQIFPDQDQNPEERTPVGAPGVATGEGDRDFNNNINENNPAGVRIRRRQVWPWQARAQQSGIYFNDFNQQAVPPVSTRRDTRDVRQERGSSAVPNSKWPWQERALKSVIFEILTSANDEKKPNGRVYKWDQRQSASVNEAVHQDPVKESVNHKKSPWPWQERANQSVVFKSPDKKKRSGQMKYVWDQRKTRFSLQLEPEAKFATASSYGDNFITWQSVQDSTKPAGKPCYKDEESVATKNKVDEKGHKEGESRRVSFEKTHENKDGKNTQALAKDESRSTERANHELTGSTTSSEKTACMEMVPLGYKFPNHVGSSGHPERGPQIISCK